MAVHGKYIVIEGADGTGKTTQAELLAKQLELDGKNVIHIKEPGGSPVAEEIRNVLLNGNLERTPMTNILLFTANRHELWNSVIRPALHKGTWVICTRSYWSTLVYQGYGEGMSRPIISAITETFTSKRYMKPDFGVILTLDNASDIKNRVAMRGKTIIPDTFESKSDEFHQNVIKGYSRLATELDVPTVEASRPIDSVHADLMKLFRSKFS